MKNNVDFADALLSDNNHLGESCFTTKIGRTTYEVNTHFNNSGRETVLKQFCDYLLRNEAFCTLEKETEIPYHNGAFAMPGCQKGEDRI